MIIKNYKMINEELRVCSFRVKELTIDEVSTMEQQAGGKKLETLKMIHDKKNDFVLINNDNPKYRYYEALVVKYMQSSPKDRLSISEEAPVKDRDVLVFLDDILRARAVRIKGYKVIDETLRVYACSINDLSYKEAEKFGLVLNGEKDDMFDLFYDKELDAVVINCDSPIHQYLEENAIRMLGADVGSGESIKILTQSARIMRPIMTKLNTIGFNRYQQRKRERMLLEAKRIHEILNIESLELINKHRPILNQLDELTEADGVGFIKDFNPFMYGYILGKREERAKRKNKH